MVIKENEIVDISIMSEDKSSGHFTPVVDVKYGISVDYDVKKQEVFWTETDSQGQTNATLYRYFGGFDFRISGTVQTFSHYEQVK